MVKRRPHIVVIGAGIGGLAAAMRLSQKNVDVSILERHDHVGGKIRTISSEAGPVDAGPTVLTMRNVFDEVFTAAGQRLTDHVTLTPSRILARHWWTDGSTLDLVNDRTENVAAISKLCGAREGAAFERFCSRAERVFNAFKAPMMETSNPNPLHLATTTARQPSLLADLAPLKTLEGLLQTTFRDPRLHQLFGRYATYVGGSPYQSPALLHLIWHAEASGVWSIKGGMHRLASAMADVLDQNGVSIRLRSEVQELAVQGKRVTGVTLKSGEHVACDAVIFNGDPQALRTGLLGKEAAPTVTEKQVTPRSLSAYVWAFAATPSGVPLSHHNVFFADDPEHEFASLKAGQRPTDATLYICAQDRGTEVPHKALERFEIIMNGPPTSIQSGDEYQICRTQTFDRLAQMGLHFDRIPPETALTTPSQFNALFPASSGSLYGRSPHGLTASLKRPKARTSLRGLYLAGGGTHPGAGIPMAALSGKHAAEAISTDLTSTLMSRRTVTPGGMSTGSTTMATRRSRSSAS